mgnify:CR=1 FL=1
MAIDFEELERLAAQITPLPWRVADKGYLYVTDANPNREIARLLMKPRAYNANAQYIVAACNELPALIAENRALQEKERELEKEKEQLLGVIGSMHSIMKQRNNMAINLITVLHDAMNKQFLNAMDESLTQSFTLIQEALDARP